VYRATSVGICRELRRSQPRWDQNQRVKPQALNVAGASHMFYDHFTVWHGDETLYVSN